MWVDCSRSFKEIWDILHIDQWSFFGWTLSRNWSQAFLHPWSLQINTFISFCSWYQHNIIALLHWTDALMDYLVPSKHSSSQHGKYAFSVFTSNFLSTWSLTMFRPFIYNSWTCLPIPTFHTLSIQCAVLNNEWTETPMFALCSGTQEFRPQNTKAQKSIVPL